MVHEQVNNYLIGCENPDNHPHVLALLDDILNTAVISHMRLLL